MTLAVELDLLTEKSVPVRHYAPRANNLKSWQY